MLYDPFRLLPGFILQLEKLLGKVFVTLLKLHLTRLGLFLLHNSGFFLFFFIISRYHLDFGIIILRCCVVVSSMLIIRTLVIWDF